MKNQLIRKIQDKRSKFRKIIKITAKFNYEKICELLYKLKRKKILTYTMKLIIPYKIRVHKISHDPLYQELYYLPIL